MTVCIAAICSEEKRFDTIVCASDMKLSQDFYSEDVATIKIRIIHPHWAVMIAGVFGRRRRILDEIREKLSDKTEVSQSEVEDAFIAAYQNYGRRLANEAVLSPYGLTVEEFLTRRADLGDVIYEKMLTDIGKTMVGCDFLVCGFGSERAHIFSVSNPTNENPSFISDHNDLSFGAIGSGAYIAESTLYAYGQSYIHKTDTTIYHACAAKFSAETATNVGEATHLRVTRKDKVVPVDIDLVKKVRKIWEKNRPTVPVQAFRAIADGLRSAALKMAHKDTLQK